MAGYFRMVLPIAKGPTTHNTTTIPKLTEVDTKMHFKDGGIQVSVVIDKQSNSQSFTSNEHSSQTAHSLTFNGW